MSLGSSWQHCDFSVLPQPLDDLGSLQTMRRELGSLQHTSRIAIDQRNGPGNLLATHILELELVTITFSGHTDENRLTILTASQL